MSEDDVRLLGASGVSHMGFGTESTSESVLKLMNKRHQRVDEMYETARKAQLGGIRVTFNLIFGYPGETEADRIITFQTMSDIGRQFPNVSFSPNIFTPYPGIPIWPQASRVGSSGTEESPRVDGHAFGRKHVALAERKGACTATTDAQVLPAEQSDRPLSEELLAAAACCPTDSDSLAPALESLLFSLGALAFNSLRTNRSPPFARNGPRASQGACQCLLAERRGGGNLWPMS